MKNNFFWTLLKTLFICCSIFICKYSKANVIIEITFIDTPYGLWTPSAKNAFLKAAEIWEKTITSSQVIHVIAKWEDLQAANQGDPVYKNVLGYARPTTEVSNFGSSDSRYYSNFFYPICLAEKLKGSEIQPSLFSREIECSFNNNGNFTWYFGVDGLCPSNQYDLVSVVMHEIGHGIGFFSGAIETDYFTPGNTYAGFRRQYIFDRYIRNTSDVGPLDFMPGGNFAPTSDSYLTSNDLFFTGTSATWNMTWSNQQIHPAIYAPSTWEAGSSISHFDEDFFNSNPNSGDHLMTPYTADGEAHHNPGYVGLGLLQDIGWDGNLYLNSDFEDQKISSKLIAYPNPCKEKFSVSLPPETELATMTIYSVDGKLMYQQKGIKNDELIDISALPKGAYLIHVLDNKKRYFKTLLSKQ